MKILERKDIDTEKWDARIADSDIENIFCYSWYLDAAADNWMSVATENYRTIVPLPFTSKLGVKQFYQAPFTREYQIFGDEFDWKDIYKILSENFKSIHFRTDKNDLFDHSEKRKHQYLELNPDWRNNYRTNAKRLVKKSSKRFTVSKSDSFDHLYRLFVDHVAKKIDSIDEKDLQKIKKLMTNALKTGSAEVIEVKENDEIVAAGFFLKDKSRITYLKGASTEKAKKDGAMYFLMDRAMEHYQPDFRIFDFGGSDIEGVANFYKKFGAVDRTYYNYTIDQLPNWFKLLKKFKK